jgi:hypothetical protein
MCNVSPTIHHNSRQAPKSAKRAKRTTPRKLNDALPRGERNVPNATISETPTTNLRSTLQARKRKTTCDTVWDAPESRCEDRSTPKRITTNTTQPEPSPASPHQSLASEETHNQRASAKARANLAALTAQPRRASQPTRRSQNKSP